MQAYYGITGCSCFTVNADYIDALEQTLYNSLLSGISVTGDRFFYPNPLSSSGQYQRASWYGVSCCPTNVVRFLPQVPGFIYAKRGNDLFVNLYMSNNCEIELNGGTVAISQKTDYPWQGNIKLEVNPESALDFTLRMRIPGWANLRPVPSDLYNSSGGISEKVKISVNGKVSDYDTEDGYAIIKRTWQSGDIIEMELPMPVLKITANNRVEENRSKFAIQRGPIVYCLEGPDNVNGMVKNLMIPLEADFEMQEFNELQKGANKLIATGYSFREKNGSDQILKEEQQITAIPYFLWANRGRAEMTVWIPGEESVTTPRPDPAPSIASKSKIIASYDTLTLNGINDRFIIPYNQNIPISNYYRWPMDDTTQWVQYIFESAQTVSSVQVYWYDNEPSTMTTWYNNIPWTCCRVPESWELFYMDENSNWLPVKATDEYGIGKYMYNTVNFEPVKTNSLKMVVERNGSCASGLQEWIVR